VPYPGARFKLSLRERTDKVIANFALIPAVDGCTGPAIGWPLHFFSVLPLLTYLSFEWNCGSDTTPCKTGSFCILSSA
jgi:hypothetical protein